MNIPGIFASKLTNWHTIVSVQAFVYLGLVLTASAIIDSINKDKFFKEFEKERLPTEKKEGGYRDKDYSVIRSKLLAKLFAGAIVGYSLFSNAISYSLNYYFDSHIKSLTHNKVLQIFAKSALQVLFPLLFSVVIFENYIVSSSLAAKVRSKIKFGYGIKSEAEYKERATKCCLSFTTERFKDLLIICGAVFAGTAAKNLLLHFLQNSTMPRILSVSLASGMGSLLVTSIALFPDFIKVLNEKTEEKIEKVKKMCLVYMGSKLLMQTLLSAAHCMIFNAEVGFLNRYFDKNNYLFSLAAGLVQVISNVCSGWVAFEIAKTYVIKASDNEISETSETSEKKLFKQQMKLFLPMESNIAAGQLFLGF